MASSKSPFGGDEIHSHFTRSICTGDQSKGSNFARLAYDYQKDGYHFEAIEFYSKAISLVPDDHRYYVNRSASYEAIEQNLMALADAGKSVELDETKPKGHFRKGRSLRLLKRFQEAEHCFQRVLELVPGCKDTIKELQLVKYKISSPDVAPNYFLKNLPPLMTHCEKYSSKTKNNYPCRIVRRSKGGSSNDLVLSCVSDAHPTDASSITVGRSGNITLEKSKKSNGENDTLFDTKFGPEQGPTNLHGYHGVYVGHIDPGACEDDITKIFSRFGNITHLRFIPQKFCAFVSYNNSKSPREAIQYLNERNVPRICVKGKNLKLNFHLSNDQDPRLDWNPDNKKRRCINNECYMWRTTGCNDEKCMLRHLKSCRGIDYQSWMSGASRRETKSSPFSTFSPMKH